MTNITDWWISPLRDESCKKYSYDRKSADIPDEKIPVEDNGGGCFGGD